MTQPRDFGFDADTTLLRDTARQLLRDRLPTEALHRLVATEHDPHRPPACHWDPPLWQQIVDLGVGPNWQQAH